MRDLIRLIETFNALAEMATRPPESVQGKTFYHGCGSTEAAKSILKNGLQPPELNGKKHFLTPVQGMVYLTPELGYALIYAAGGNYVGNASYRVPYRGANKEQFDHILRGRNGKEERYGFVFEVTGDALQMVQPDEDEIGGLYGWCLENGPSKYHDKRDHDIWASFNADTRMASNFKNLLNHCATDRQKAAIKWGEVGQYANVGKKAAKRMSDEMKAWLVSIGLHVAHQGALRPTACYKFDKTKIGFMDKDGTNFLDFAKKIR